VSLEQQSWVGSAASVGALLGTLLARKVAQTLGARKGLIVCGVASVIGWALILTSSQVSLYVIYPGLAFLGCSCGLSAPLSSIYVSEIAGKGNKGVVTSIFNFNITFGVLFANILGSLTNWYVSSLTMMGIHILMFFALLTLIHSPQELARAGKEKQVQEVLVKLRNVDADQVVEEANIMMKDVEDEKLSHKLNLVETLQSLGESGLLKLCTAMVVVTMTHLSGCTVITTYVVDIFSSSAIPEILLVLVTGFSEMGFSFFQLLIADRLGRKTFLIFSGIGCSLSSLVFAAIFWNISKSEDESFVPEIVRTILSSTILLVATLIIYFLSFNIGFGPIKHTLVSEMFTTEEQVTVAGICHTWYWIVSFLAVKMFHMMVVNLGLVIIFIIISAICFASSIFTFFCVPETRKR